MILVRLVFQAKFGRAAQLASEMAKAQAARVEAGERSGPVRVLTDLSGPFDTVVFEIEVESLAAWEKQRQKAFAAPEFADTFQRTNDLIESGRTEFYTIES
jgi:predicted Rdx family selenoprotein